LPKIRKRAIKALKAVEERGRRSSKTWLSCWRAVPARYFSLAKEEGANLTRFGYGPTHLLTSLLDKISGKNWAECVQPI